jgi:hypothetical protein
VDVEGKRRVGAAAGGVDGRGIGMRRDGAKGLRKGISPAPAAATVLNARGLRLCGNCSGRGCEWVRSKRPHLLHNYEKNVVSAYSNEVKHENTCNLPRPRIASPPRARVHRTAIEAPYPHAITEFRRRIVVCTT